MLVSKVISFFAKTVDRIYLLCWEFLRNVQAKTSDSVRCLNGKTAIVTGGNMGIGFGTSLLLASRGCKVIIACRSDATEAIEKIAELTGNSKISSRKLDLSSLKSVREFAESIKREERKIDILINNAGMGAVRQKMTDDGLNTLMQINYFGHFLLTHLLSDLLKSSNGGRIVFLTSPVSFSQNLTIENLNKTNFENNVFIPVELYANSKFAQTLAAQEFAKKLGKFGILVNAADPGMCRTTIYEKSMKEQDNTFFTRMLLFLFSVFNRSIWQAAQTSFHLATSDQLEGNGDYYHYCQKIPKLWILQNEQYCQEIWKKTEELVQLKPEEKL